MKFFSHETIFETLSSFDNKSSQKTNDNAKRPEEKARKKESILYCVQVVQRTEFFHLFAN